MTPPLECQGSLPKYEGVSETAIVIDSESSAKGRLMQAFVRDALRVALRRRGLPTKRFEGRPDQETDAWVWRAGTDGRSSSGAVFRQATHGSRPGGLASTDDVKRRNIRVNDLG